MFEGAEPREGRIAVCTRVLILPDSSFLPRLVEWLDLLFLMRVDKVVVSYYHLAEEIMRTFQWYQELGFVDLVHRTMAGHHPR